MRLFVAIDVPDSVKDHASFVQRSLDVVKGPLWVPPKNIHLTLNFIGEQTQTRTTIDLLKTITFSSFTLRLNELVFFPPHEPRLMWLTLHHSEELLSLQSRIDLLFTPDKSFKPHLTLARLKNTPSQSYEILMREATALHVKQLSFPVHSFRLYKSTLTTVGPIYEVLETFTAQQPPRL